MRKKTVEQNQIVVSMERSDVVRGSQKTVALGQGVKARTGKDASGKIVVEAFYFDRDRYSDEKVDKWLEKHENKIFESLHYVQVQSPQGSFESITMRIQAALDDSDEFTGYVRVEFVFADHVIVCAPEKGDYWDVPYEDTGTDIEFGTPAKVAFDVVKEKIRESNKKIEKNSRPNLNIEDERMSFRLKESSFDEEAFEKTGDLTIVIIEAGVNYNKRRYYPKKTLQESAEIYASLKQYLDHPTDAEEASKPERSVREWLSTIKESWYEDGMVLGTVHIHPGWFKESMKDPVFRQEIGVSINAAGRMHVGDIDGTQMQVMDAITSAKSVDWVTEAGARGRVLQLMESAKLEQEHKEIEHMEIKEFKEKHKALFDQIVKEAKGEGVVLTEAQINERIEAGVKEKMKEQEKIQEKAKAVEARKAKATEIVAGSKLPEKHRARFLETILRENAEAADDKFEVALKEGIINEIKYLNGLGAGIKIDVEAGHQGGGAKTVVESATQDILKTAGLDKVGIKENA